MNKSATDFRKIENSQPELEFTGSYTGSCNCLNKGKDLNNDFESSHEE